MVEVVSQNWSAGRHVISLPKGTQMQDGWRLVLTRESWPKEAKGELFVFGFYSDERRLLRGPVGVEGGVVKNKSGEVEAYSWIGGTWPGEFEGETRTPLVPDALVAEVEFDREVTFSVQFDTVSTGGGPVGYR